MATIWLVSDYCRATSQHVDLVIEANTWALLRVNILGKMGSISCNDGCEELDESPSSRPGTENNGVKTLLGSFSMYLPSTSTSHSTYAPPQVT